MAFLSLFCKLTRLLTWQGPVLVTYLYPAQ